MPTKKSARKTTRSTSRKVTRASENTQLSLDTRTIITLLLLLLLYPVGVGFMWAWMKPWPVWLKFIISLPLVIMFLSFFGMLVLFGSLVRHARDMRGFEEQRQMMMQPSTPPVVSLTPTVTPYNFQ